MFARQTRLGPEVTRGPCNSPVRGRLTCKLGPGREDKVVEMPGSLESLIAALKRLPGVGPKSAQRMAYHLLQYDRDGASQLGAALTRAAANVQHCSSCNTFTESEICAMCSSDRRD